MRVIECEVVRDDELEALPYESVVPYSTDDVADSLVVQVIVAPVAVVDEATEEMVGGVRSIPVEVVIMILVPNLLFPASSYETGRT